MPSLEEKIEDFSECLKNSKRVLALLGAGLSAASGLPTFRGAGGFWRTYEATELATPEAFEENPGLVWEFYSYRRHMSLEATPNPGHYALAKLAEVHPDFTTMSQNVDGLSSRAGHPSDKIHYLHGNLFTVKCSDEQCAYVENNNFTDPIAPCLTQGSINGPNQPAPNSNERIPVSELPHCPKCNSLLRPGVVWFSEALPEDVLGSIDDWLNAEEKIDLMLVIGTSSTVWPAVGYVEVARELGARIAVVNLEPDASQRGEVTSRDWLFEGDSSVLLPKMLKSSIEKC